MGFYSGIVPDSEQVCGYQEKGENLPNGIYPLPCEEATWRDKSRCIWHSEVKQKPADELARYWDTAPERIDGIYLEEARIGDRLDFSQKELYSGNFCGAELTQSNFQGSQLDMANFSEANLRSADFKGELTKATKADFSCATCIDTRFQHSKLHNASFAEADLKSAKLQHADLADANLTNSKLHEAKMMNSNLRSAEMDSAQLYKSKCGQANFESASLKDADLRGASFVDADIFDADFRDADADHQTDFGNQVYREFNADRSAEPQWLHEWTNLPDKSFRTRGPTRSSELCRNERGNIEYDDEYWSRREEYLENLRFYHLWVAAASRLVTRSPIYPFKCGGIEQLSEAEKTYRDLKHLFIVNPVPEYRRRFNIREKEVKRKIAYSNREISWFRWSILRWSMKYGESANQVLKASLGVIILCALIYPIWGLQIGSSEPLQYSLNGEISIDSILLVLFYSLRRLISPTNGSISPLGPTEWIALGESTLGVLLTAMLVFVLGRRATS